MTVHRNDQPLAFNGVDAEGAPLFGEPSLEDLAEAALGESLRGIERRQLEDWVRRTRARSLGPKEGVDPRRLEQAGWGAVFAADADPVLRLALAPLLEHRGRQAGTARSERFRVLAGASGYRRGESKQRFLARHGMGPGPADPDRMPYYLLLVGEPEAIPFDFQYQLDVQYAVGRVCFDSLDEYHRYARSVVAAEAGELRRPRRAAFFGVRKPGDRATELTHDLLVEPLARGLAGGSSGWDVVTAAGAKATRERLCDLLGGDEAPALLFTGSHGLGFRRPDPRQRAEQGALVCAAGAADRGDGDSRLFTAAEVGDAAPGGLISFHFACYSAGTPQRNGYLHRGGDEPAEISDRPFVARLPQRLLGHPGGGAQAVVGHIDRTWTYSFAWPDAGRQLEVFASALRRLLAGHPLGSAMEYFNQRYAELECDLAELRDRLALGVGADLLQLVGLWTARNDARTFTVLGDPAVRLAVPRDGGRSVA